MTAATAVRERGITFSAPMIQALQREVDPKWQTRRLINPQPLVQSLFSGDGPALPRRHWCIDNAKQSRRFAWPVGSKAEVPAELCPYGKPGGRLYVKEAWYVGKCADGYKPSELAPKVWKVDNGGLWYPADATEPKTPISPKGRYRNARFMPRWASRITLEITEVRVQQLQEISEADARAEGISVLPLQSADDPSAWWQSAPGIHQDRTARGSFIQLWDSIHGDDYPWACNPWVFAISFTVLKGGSHAQQATHT